MSIDTEAMIGIHLAESPAPPTPSPEDDQGIDDVAEDDTTAVVHTSKPLRKGKHFSTSGHVKAMKDCQKEQFYFVKAQVMASHQLKVL